MHHLATSRCRSIVRATRSPRLTKRQPENGVKSIFRLPISLRGYLRFSVVIPATAVLFNCINRSRIHIIRVIAFRHRLNTHQRGAFV